MNLSNEEINKGLTQLARKMGKENASALLSTLGRDKQFLNAIETPMGQELLKDAVSSIENIISLILDEKDELKDRAELKAYLTITNKWQKTITRYHKNKGVFEKNIT